LQDAENRGDRYAVAHLRAILQTWIHLIDDAPDEALAELDRAFARWPQQGSAMQRLFEAVIRLQIVLYRGDARAAWELVVANTAFLDRSLLMWLQQSRLLWQSLRLHAAVRLAAVPATSDRERRVLVRSAEADIRRIERENVPWSNPQALIGRANLAVLRGRRGDALTLMAAGEDGFRAADMMVHAMGARRRRGRLLGGAEGEALVQEADSWMTAQTIRNPVRMSTIGGSAGD
jgi:hypothetical protein